MGGKTSILDPFLKRIAELEKRGLKMDAESRMARAKEQGDTGYDFYHATTADFPRFDLTKAGRANTVGRSERAAFLTDSGERAGDFVSNGYAVDYKNGWGPDDLKAARDKYLEVYASSGEKAANQYWRDAVLPNTPTEERFAPGAQVMPLRLLDRGGGFSVYDWNAPYAPDDVAQAIKEARSEKNDAVVFKNMIDGGYMQGGKKQNVVAVLNPAAIRSRFAAFDPTKIDSRDLLAGAVPGAAATGVTIEELRDYLNRDGE